MDHLAESRWQYSLMISVCRLWMNGEIRSLMKLSGSCLPRVVCTAWTSPLETCGSLWTPSELSHLYFVCKPGILPAPHCSTTARGFTKLQVFDYQKHQPQYQTVQWLSAPQSYIPKLVNISTVFLTWTHVYGFCFALTYGVIISILFARLDLRLHTFSLSTESVLHLQVHCMHEYTRWRQEWYS